MLKISVITVCFDSADSIAKSIQSVLGQSYPNIEYIIKEGNSSDNTGRIIEPYLSDPRVVYQKSRDNGIYDAINQAIALASGDILCFLHSDDEFANKYVLSTMAQVLVESDEVEACYGNVIFRQDEKVVRYWRSGQYKAGFERYGWMIPHTALFVRAETHRRIGPYVEKFRISADYDYVLRLITDAGQSLVYVDEDVVFMEVGGASTSGIRSFITKLIEDVSILKKNGICAFVVLLKIFRKLPQVWNTKPIKTNVGDDV